MKLEIGLRETGTEDDTEATTAAAAQDTLLELTDEDRRTLRSMKIRFDEGE